MKKNVLIIVSKLYNKGLEKKACMLASKLSDRYNVYILTSNLKTKAFDNFNIIEVKETKRLNLIGLLGIKKIKKIKKQLNIDCSISFGFKSNLYNVLSKFNEKVIVSVTNLISVKKNIIRDFLYKKIILKKADKIVTVSSLIVDDLIHRFGAHKNKISVIYNFYDSKYIDENKDLEIENKYNYIFESNNVIANVGRLDEQKGQIYLIKAFKYVLKKIPDAKLIILGGGSLMTRLNQCALDEGVYNDFMLMDYQKNPFKYLKKSDILVSTSLYEWMPNCIIESMYLGLPIVSSDCDFGPREILSNNNSLTNKIEKCEYGILFPCLTKKNEEQYIKQIADSIIMILKNKKLRNQYSDLSKERSKDFESEIITKKWYEIIEG